MRVRILMVAVTMFSLSTLSPAGRADQEAKTELKQWQGIWNLESQTIGGWELPKRQRDAMWMEIHGDIMTKTGVGGGGLKYKITLDPTTNPKSIDLVSQERRRDGKVFVQKGIYEWDGKTLRMCFDNTGKSRPKEFKSPKDKDNIYLSVLKRKDK